MRYIHTYAVNLPLDISYKERLSSELPYITWDSNNIECNFEKNVPGFQKCLKQLTVLSDWTRTLKNRITQN